MYRILVLALLSGWSLQAARGVDILWDKYGVPHIYAKTTAGAFYAYGWAQMHSHGERILMLYAQSRGQGAKYFGAAQFELDQWVHTQDVPRRAVEWRNAQEAKFRGYTDAFAEGMNDYVKAHPDEFSAEAKAVLPILPTDPYAHTMRVVHFTFVSSGRGVAAALGQAQAAREPNGSNAWAVGPSRSASKRSMLLTNPHLPWNDLYTYYEADIHSPDYTVYGISQIGFPVLRMAFNDQLGWAQTVNTLDASDLFALKPDGDGYSFDGARRAFTMREATIEVKGEASRKISIRESVHGPVVGMRGTTPLALRVAGVDRPEMLRAYFEMGRARNLREFQAALDRHQIPMYTVMYADKAGNILHLFNGLVPRRKKGDQAFWAGVVPGDSSDYLWTEYHAQSELPRVLNPASGYLQNTNDPPWYTTLPFPLKPADYPAYMAPRNMSLRAQRSVRLLEEDKQISFEEFARYKHDTRMELADRVMPDLLAAVAASGNDAAKRAASVLEKWDRAANAESEGALLFLHFAQKLMGPTLASSASFAVPFDGNDPLTTPRGLKDPARAVQMLADAAAETEKTYGAIDRKWGEVVRFRAGNLSLPANGGLGNLGIFRVITPGPMKNGQRDPMHGETYVCIVEFGDKPQARSLISYGNSSQKGSKHIEDQLPFLARKELRTVWRERAEVEKNLELREKL
jgi:acyl-homoserine-lactone acylase